MILWFIILQVITDVLGYRDQYSYSTVLNMKQSFCPDLHVTVPDMDPYICVSYAEICKDVTEVDILVAQNRTQYICHPRFQPFAP